MRVTSQPSSPPPPASAPVAGDGPSHSARKDDAAEGLVSRVWRGLFGGGDGDYERRLQSLSKEESSVRRRLAKRARTARGAARNVLSLASALEVMAVSFAIMTTRSPDMSWQDRAIRVSPMFLLPALAALVYFALNYFIRMLDQRDQSSLEKLRAERQAKIDELKERTNYYLTQQLIQRYDLDPAAKAAAASVLASKLGADSGLRFFVGDDSDKRALGQHSDHLGSSMGLRHRKPGQARSRSAGASPVSYNSEPFDDVVDDPGSPEAQDQGASEQLVNPGSDGGWLARIAALLVGEDPTQCYALICRSCHMHNGLARKEDFLFITYYCPHCQSLNGRSQPVEHGAASMPSGEALSSLPGSSNSSPVASRSSPTTEIVASTLETIAEHHDDEEPISQAASAVTEVQ